MSPNDQNEMPLQIHTQSIRGAQMKFNTSKNIIYTNLNQIHRILATNEI